jgi:hypothetical protein
MKPMQHSGRKPPTAKKSDLRQSVMIEASFGSEIQCTVAMRLLDQFLAAWKEATESHHKKNSIRIIQEREFVLRSATAPSRPVRWKGSCT